MAKLPRVLQQLFGRDGSASHFGQFGSRAGGVPLFTKDPSTIQQLSAFITDGWLDAINNANKAPFLEDMNSLFLLIFYQIAYVFQEGISEWDPSTEYFIGSIVKKTGTFEQYGSLVDNNQGNPLPNQTNNGFWQYLNPAPIAPGLIFDFGGGTVPFGYLACDGTVYAQASFPGLFNAIGVNWNTGGEGPGNFRVPDLRGRVTLGAGTGSGLSPRTLAQIFGEENHVLVVGEMPVHTHSINDAHTHTLIIAGSDGVVAIQNGGPNQGISGGGPGGGSWREQVTGGILNNITANNTGGGAGHNNIQPSAVVTKIIKT